jgi:hypothetical protein
MMTEKRKKQTWTGMEISHQGTITTMATASVVVREAAIVERESTKIVDVNAVESGIKRAEEGKREGEVGRDQEAEIVMGGGTGAGVKVERGREVEAKIERGGEIAVMMVDIIAESKILSTQLLCCTKFSSIYY